jgi:hypothetical protein
MYYIGLDVHKKTISYCVKDVSGRIQQEGKVGSTRRELDCWMKTLPQPWSAGMEATIFSGWIYDHLLPHAAQIKVAHLLMLRAIAAAKKKNDQIDANKIADCLRCNFLPECHMMPAEISASSMVATQPRSPEHQPCHAEHPPQSDRNYIDHPGERLPSSRCIRIARTQRRRYQPSSAAIQIQL